MYSTITADHIRGRFSSNYHLLHDYIDRTIINVFSPENSILDCPPKGMSPFLAWFVVTSQYAAIIMESIIKMFFMIQQL